jgi:hypothetical protein
MRVLIIRAVSSPVEGIIIYVRMAPFMIARIKRISQIAKDFRMSILSPMCY